MNQQLPQTRRVLSPAPSAQWSCPDKMFLSDAPKIISSSEKIKFWEMVRSLLELPVLASKLVGRLRDAEGIAKLLCLPEYKALWTDLQDASFIPHKQALDLCLHAYVPK
jgi:hypothetical protein